MVDDKGNSKGFGFVCFTSAEEAQRAITEMNSRILQGCTKPLYVALHEPKEVRRQKLIQRHNSRNQMRSGPVPTPSNVYPATQPVFYGSVPTAYYYPNQVVPRGRGAWTSHPAPYPAPSSTPVYQGQQGAPASRGGRGGGVPSNTPNGGRGGNNNNRRSKKNPQQEKGEQQAAGYDLTLEFLQQFPPEQQKMHLGERLYPLIHKSQPSLAGKITGMLLDSGWSNEELLSLIKDEDKLFPKIQEAVEVLERANILPAEGAQ